MQMHFLLKWDLGFGSIYFSVSKFRDCEMLLLPFYDDHIFIKLNIFAVFLIARIWHYYILKQSSTGLLDKSV